MMVPMLMIMMHDEDGDGGADATVSVNGEVVGSLDSVDEYKLLSFLFCCPKCFH